MIGNESHLITVGWVQKKFLVFSKCSALRCSPSCLTFLTIKVESNESENVHSGIVIAGYCMSQRSTCILFWYETVSNFEPLHFLTFFRFLNCFVSYFSKMRPSFPNFFPIFPIFSHFLPKSCHFWRILVFLFLKENKIETFAFLRVQNLNRRFL